jgi:hypothetical protein
MIQQIFLDGVAVEPGDRANRRVMVARARPRPSISRAKTFDVGPADLEQPLVALGAPGRVLAQVQRLCLAGQSGVTGQEPRQPPPLLALNTGSGTEIAVDADVAVVVVIGYLPGRAETLEAGPAVAPATMIHPTVNPLRRSRKVTKAFLPVSRSPNRASARCLSVLGQGGCITPCSGSAAVHRSTTPLPSWSPRNASGGFGGRGASGAK